MQPSALFRSASAFALLALTTAGCGGTSSASSPGGGGGQRRTSTVVLGTADVAKVTRGTIEAGIPVAGDLRPIETLSLKSRLEGNVEQVFVREGDRVAAGAQLARFEAIDFESALKSAEADVLSSRTAAVTAQWNYDQSKDLFKIGAIAERDLRATEQAAAAAKAQQAASESRLRASQSTARDTRISAPVSGTIQFRRVQGGEHVLRGSELFTLVRTEMLELTASLPARRANDVRPGQAVRFLADGRTFTGKVARVSPTIDPASRSITAYVQIPNPRGELKGNTFSSGQIIAQVLENVLVVPQPAVRTGQDGKTFVYKIAGGELAQAPVTVGTVDDARGLVEITSGLVEREEVVVGNVGTLGRGMKVQVVGNERGSTPGGARGGGARGDGARGGGARGGTAAQPRGGDSAAKGAGGAKPPVDGSRRAPRTQDTRKKPGA